MSQLGLPPGAVKRENGIVWIDTAVDQAFKQALLAGVPASVRGKMREALAALPQRGAAAHAQRYFGAELPTIVERVTPLLIELNMVLSESFNLPGLFDWLTATGYGNDYRMIKAFDAWAQLGPARPKAPGIIRA